MQYLTGQVALVTGAAAGIGWATARCLAGAGARVVLADLDGRLALARAAELGPQHRAVRLDVTDAASLVSLFKEWPERFERLDVLVNNAGRTDARGLPLIEHDSASVDAILSVNLTGVRETARLAFDLMRDRGGVVVNLASGAAYRALPLRGAYSASKAAVVGMTRALAGQAQGTNVRFHAVSPGLVHTELVAELIASGRLDPAEAAERIPIGRMGQPAEIADPIVFLAGPRARHLNGIILDVDGGSHASGGNRRYPVRASDTRRVGGATVILGGPEADTSGADGTPEVIEGGTAMAGESLETRLNGIAGTRGSVGAVIDAGAGADAAASPAEALECLFRRAKAVGRFFLQSGAGSYVVFVPANLFENAVDSAAYRTGAGMLVRTFACEWAARGLRANAVVGHDFADAASLCMFLASSSASFATAAVVDTTGLAATTRS